MKSVLFVIAARGGSKGVPRKNIKKIGELPLIAYKINAAKKVGMDKRIIVSTDDDEIAEVALSYGAEVPFIRPQELSTDTASSVDVVEHALKWVLENDDKVYDYVCLLEPSSPFATSNDLEKALELIISRDADTLLGMKEVEVSSKYIHQLDSNGGLSKFFDVIQNMKSVRRQDQEKEYTMNGCMYIAKIDYFLKNKSFHSEKSLPYIMPPEKSIEIDSMSDYMYACFLVKEGFINIQDWSL